MTGIVGTFFVGGSHEEPDLPSQSPGQLLLCDMPKKENILPTIRLKICIMEKDDKPEMSKSGQH